MSNFPGKNLLYKKYGHVHISEYFDSGYAGDKGDRKSTNGYYTFFGVTLRLGGVRNKMWYLDLV